MLSLMAIVFRAARCMLLERSYLTMLCSSTAVGASVTNPRTSSTEPFVARNASNTLLDTASSPAICFEIWSVASQACRARDFTSPATTAKPCPASPARADLLLR